MVFYHKRVYSFSLLATGGFWVEWLCLTASDVCSFWKEGEPNNDGDEDCVELFMDDWNDNKCTEQNFWVCEQPSAPCPHH